MGRTFINGRETTDSRRAHSALLPHHEISIETSLGVLLAYEAYTGEDEDSNDPFDILVRKEEDFGMPLVDMPADND